ncbi:MAG: AlpA family phage regulatory protein [Holosporaceae bacterium]|nr:AlpA family phage regulatory protein [Holosporaceae bacterium]
MGKFEIVINGERYLLLPEVLEIVGLKQSTVYEKMRYNCFPKPLKADIRSLWKLSDIDEYVGKNRKE